MSTWTLRSSNGKRPSWQSEYPVSQALRNRDHVTVRVCKLDHPKISRRLEAIDTHSFISKLPEATWQELGVKPLFKHRETRKPAGLTKGRARLSLPVLT